MSRRVSASLSEAECSALQAHPDYRGSLGGLLRLLALRHIGQEPADPYDKHRARARDEKGRMMSKSSVAFEAGNLRVIRYGEEDGLEKPLWRVVRIGENGLPQAWPLGGGISGPGPVFSRKGDAVAFAKSLT